MSALLEAFRLHTSMASTVAEEIVSGLAELGDLDMPMVQDVDRMAKFAETLITAYAELNEIEIDDVLAMIEFREAHR